MTGGLLIVGVEVRKSLQQSIAVFWRGLTGGKEGFRKNSRLVVLVTEKKSLKAGLDTELALQAGLAEALLNVNKLAQFANATSEYAIKEASIFVMLTRDNAIERLLDYLVWKTYQDTEARERLEVFLAPLIQEMIDQDRFDPIKETTTPTFAWSAFTPKTAIEKARSDLERLRNRRPWEKTQEERRLGAQELRCLARECFEQGKNHLIGKDRPPDKVLSYGLWLMLRDGWKYMARSYGSYQVYNAGGDTYWEGDWELEPFMRLHPERAREVALEYVVWRMFPDQADQAMIKEAVSAYVDEVKQDRPEIADTRPGDGAVFWMDLINGDKLARPWGDPSNWT